MGVEDVGLGKNANDNADNMNKLTTILAAVAIAVALAGAGCMDTDANVASRNLTTAADQFEISRRIIFYNGITGEYMLSIEGMCSLGNYDDPGELSVMCKTGPDSYKKHFLGLSDNVTYFVEQVEPSRESAGRYRVVFKPLTIIPDIDIE